MSHPEPTASEHRRPAGQTRHVAGTRGRAEERSERGGEMTRLRKIKLVALDSDGVLLNDTYSPVIERFVTKHGGEYTAAVERGVWGSPQLAAGQNMALACRLPWTAKETIAAFFAERGEYLKAHPSEVMP